MQPKLRTTSHCLPFPCTCNMPTEISFKTDLRGKKIWEKQLYKLNKIFKKQEVKGQDTQPGYLDSIPISLHELCHEGQHSCICQCPHLETGVIRGLASQVRGNDTHTHRPACTCTHIPQQWLVCRKLHICDCYYWWWW